MDSDQLLHEKEESPQKQEELLQEQPSLPHEQEEFPREYYQEQQQIHLEELPEKYRPLSPWAYWGLSILYIIPLIGWIFLLVFTFSGNNINRRNFTRSFWCWDILALIAFLVLGSIFWF